jgi:hypothetical protein
VFGEASVCATHCPRTLCPDPCIRRHSITAASPLATFRSHRRTQRGRLGRTPCERGASALSVHHHMHGTGHCGRSEATPASIRASIEAAKDNSVRVSPSTENTAWELRGRSEATLGAACTEGKPGYGYAACEHERRPLPLGSGLLRNKSGHPYQRPIQVRMTRASSSTRKIAS